MVLHEPPESGCVILSSSPTGAHKPMLWHPFGVRMIPGFMSPGVRRVHLTPGYLVRSRWEHFHMQSFQTSSNSSSNSYLLYHRLPPVARCDISRLYRFCDHATKNRIVFLPWPIKNDNLVERCVCYSVMKQAAPGTSRKVGWPQDKMAGNAPTGVTTGAK